MAGKRLHLRSLAGHGQQALVTTYRMTIVDLAGLLIVFSRSDAAMNRSGVACTLFRVAGLLCYCQGSAISMSFSG